LVGTALSALLNLADIVPARLLFAASATAGALANGWLAGADSLTSALVSRFLAGACLAGVYPPAMKMAATWFRERRGLAVGTVVGALTVGKAGRTARGVPGRRCHRAGRVAVALFAAAIVWLVSRRPYPSHGLLRGWSAKWDLPLAARHRRLHGHMAELYSY
jgi:MFS family permease